MVQLGFVNNLYLNPALNQTSYYNIYYKLHSGDTMQKSLFFNYDATVDINLGTKMVKVLIKGCDINSSTCRPCGCIKISSWRQKERVKNPRGLMCLYGCVYPFNGVLFDVSCSLILALCLWMFNFIELLSVNRYGGANSVGP